MKAEEGIVRDGTRQDDRLLPALRAGYINVDDACFEDLLAMAAEYAGLLEYRDMSNRSGGDWRAFFEADEACILASIIATNLNLIEVDFLSALAKSENLPQSLSEENSGEGIFAALGLVQKINSWHSQLSALSSEEALRTYEKVSDIIKDMLREEFQNLCVVLESHGKDVAGTVIPELGKIWHKPESSSNEFEMLSPEPPVDIECFLKSNFYSFRNAVLLLQEWAKDSLPLSLNRSNHDPAIGLFIAFLKLFGKVQGKINDFTQRHINFYYEDVLKMRYREYVPDSVHLVFSPDLAGRKILIAKGTEFKAGLDEHNEELIYSADNELTVTDARVHSMHTLFFERDQLISPEKSLIDDQGGDGLARAFATSAKLNRMIGNKGLADKEASKAQPLFGSCQHSKAEFHVEDADIGFAVTSSVLLMKQGDRDVVMTFEFEPDRKEDIQIDILGAFSESLNDILKTTPQDAFFKTFRYMFRIFLTGEQGWLEIEEYFPLSCVVDSERCAGNKLKIQMHLPNSAGAIVPYSSELHGDGFETDLPIAKFYLNPVAYSYPYSLLKRLVIKEIVIEVDVKGCTDVMIYNQQGQMNAKAQFNPFGAIPSLGDYLIVGNYEAVRKELTDFEVKVEWAGLPREMNGFEEYYRAYSMPISNSVFKVKLSVLSDSQWIPLVESEQAEMNLFESSNMAGDSENNRVEKQCRISLRGLCKGFKPMQNVSEESYGYAPDSKDGFFKFTLSNPPLAFGHKTYPLVLSRIMTENAQLSKFGFFKQLRKALPPMPLPNQPYTPLIDSISINYRAITRINRLDLVNVASAKQNRLREKFFHLHPLGLEAMSSKTYGKTHLVPQYGADGNLFIGISASRLSGMLTLFFHLSEDSLPDANSMKCIFSWHYLSGNQWKRLEKFRIVSDTTCGFLSSGIVTLDIPADIERGSTILQGDLYWLRVSADGGDIHALCSLYSVHTQALKASWERQTGNSCAHLAEKLPAGTIKEAKFSITGIQEIHQIMDSFGGALPESSTQYKVRVSERLRHKNRAVTPWDYERLILHRFPEIYKVKCFPRMSGNVEFRGGVKPGNLLIVLIPYRKESASENMSPMVNALLLREVREFAAELSSAFAEIHVRNPEYEQIQVRCKVRLRKGIGRRLQHNELNRAIENYLSPWNSSGLKVKFGWQIRCDEILSHIQKLDYVEVVSGLSLLHIMKDDEHLYRLVDTARKEPKEAVIKPAYPWSIAIPAKQHLLEIEDDEKAWTAEKTGIDSLSIGSNFILSRGNE